MLRLRAAFSPGPAPRAAGPPAMEPGPDGPAAPGPAAIREGWFRETCSLWPGQALSLQVEQLLHHQRSRYQDILVFRRYHRRPSPAPPRRLSAQTARCPPPREPAGAPAPIPAQTTLFLLDPCHAPFTSGRPQLSLPVPPPAKLS